jgi:peptide/nickel transport system permease protein
MPKFVILWTDVVVWSLIVGLAAYALILRRNVERRANWMRVLRDPAALGAAVVMAVFLIITALDSVHFRRLLEPSAGASASQPAAYSTRTESLLDWMMAHQIATREASWSAPLAYQALQKESMVVDGRELRAAPRLQFGGAHLSDPEREWLPDVLKRGSLGAMLGLIVACTGLLMLVWATRAPGQSFAASAVDLAAGRKDLPWRTAAATWLVICLIAGVVVGLMGHYHVLGTDRTGNDVLYQGLKSIRTAFVIGSLATLATLPFAIVLGVLAGYFGGWVDDLIQYVYTTLSSVPNVLLIAACVLMVQVFIDKNPQLFETGLERADLRIFLLCAILGITGWAGLCRLIRAETLKLRELDYVQAAHAFGVSHWRIMVRHVLPNVMHLVLITTVLEFSGLVLYEAVLSYVGVGVDPSTQSFGGMINLARAEMSRDPIVWWSFSTAFVMMVAMVLAANLLADGVRDAFDPRARAFRPRLLRTSTQAKRP